jgi:hypothetical protein
LQLHPNRRSGSRSGQNNPPYGFRGGGRLGAAEIRDLRLCKRDYSGFEEYCQAKWGWEQRYTRYVIAGAQAVKSLPGESGTMVPSERAARELAKGEPDQRAGVVQAIVDAGKPVTAADVAKVSPMGDTLSLATMVAVSTCRARVQAG